MKNLTQVLIVLFCLCMPALLHAQRDDSKYLAGAVPEVDGKVVFTKDFSIPGMSQDTNLLPPVEVDGCTSGKERE